MSGYDALNLIENHRWLTKKQKRTQTKMHIKTLFWMSKFNDKYTSHVKECSWIWQYNGSYFHLSSIDQYCIQSATFLSKHISMLQICTEIIVNFQYGSIRKPNPNKQLNLETFQIFIATKLIWFIMRQLFDS